MDSKEQPHPAYLIFLGELQSIVGFQPVNVVSKICHWNGRVITHTCQAKQKGGRSGKGRNNCSAKQGDILLHAQGRPDDNVEHW